MQQGSLPVETFEDAVTQTALRWRYCWISVLCKRAGGRSTVYLISTFVFARPRGAKHLPLRLSYRGRALVHRSGMHSGAGLTFYPVTVASTPMISRRGLCDRPPNPSSASSLPPFCRALSRGLRLVLPYPASTPYPDPTPKCHPPFKARDSESQYRVSTRGLRSIRRCGVAFASTQTRDRNLAGTSTQSATTSGRSSNGSACEVRADQRPTGFGLYGRGAAASAHVPPAQDSTRGREALSA